MSVFHFLSFFFLLTWILGKFLAKFHIPWIFSSLLIGTALVINNPFLEITGSESITFISELGMYFLLFLLGAEIQLIDK